MLHDDNRRHFHFDKNVSSCLLSGSWQYRWARRNGERPGDAFMNIAASRSNADGHHGIKCCRYRDR